MSEEPEAEDADVDEKIIHSVQEFIARIELERDLLLFRGQNDDDPLVPKIARPWSKNANWLPAVRRREDYLITEFKRRGFNLEGHPNLPTDEGDLLSVAQHYGLATRLLDWTENALAALFFAVDDDQPDPANPKTPVVWMFAPSDLHRVPLNRKNEDGSAFDFRDPPYTMVFQPNHVASRIRAQSGWFTIHTLEDDKRVPLEESRHKSRLTKFTVRKPTVIRTDLDRIGINAASLFPDIGGLTRHLNWAAKKRHPFKKKA